MPRGIYKRKKLVRKRAKKFGFKIAPNQHTRDSLKIPGLITIRSSDTLSYICQVTPDLKLLPLQQIITLE